MYVHNLAHISIHTLLAESDTSVLPTIPAPAISIHTLLAESDGANYRPHVWTGGISIHTLLAESDRWIPVLTLRTACYFYPHSPCGERRISTAPATSVFLFLSTLSLRRATVQPDESHRCRKISIHTLLAESDSSRSSNSNAFGISIHTLLAESDFCTDILHRAGK